MQISLHVSQLAMGTTLRQTDKKNLSETFSLWTASCFPTVETRVWHSRFKIQIKGLLGLHTYFVYLCVRDANFCTKLAMTHLTLNQSLWNLC